MKFIVTKNRDGSLTTQQIPDSSSPQLLGAVRLFHGDGAPNQEQMAALFSAPTSPSLLLEMDAAYSALLNPEDQAAFSPHYLAVRGFVQLGKKEWAADYVQRVQVPVELEAAKAQILAMLA